MDLGLEGKVALVMAGTSGLGRAAAAALAAEGVRVCLTGRDAAHASEVAAAITPADATVGEVMGVGMDVEDLTSVECAIRACETKLGPVDIAVLNGPGPAPANPSEVSVEAAEAAFTRLVSPHLTAINLVLPGMRERGWGRIIAIASTAVITASQQLVLSTMGRSALVGYLKALAGEVGADGVTVNVVHPGRVLTPRIEQLDEDQAQRSGVSTQQVRSEFESQIPVRRLGRPQELGQAVAYLASEAAAYVTGSAIRVDGGSTPVM